MVRRLLLTSFVLVFSDAASMVIFLLFVSVLMLVVEREAEPYTKHATCLSVYMTHWQVALFIQGLLLIDANFTGDISATSIGVGLLLLNVVMIIVVAHGSQETFRQQLAKRASGFAGAISRSSFSSRMSRMTDDIEMNDFSRSVAGSNPMISTPADQPQSANQDRSRNSSLTLDVDVDLSNVSRHMAEAGNSAQ